MRCAMLSGNHDLVKATSSAVLLIFAPRQNGCSGICVTPPSHTSASITSTPRSTPNNPPITLSSQPSPIAFTSLASNQTSMPHTISAATNTTAYAAAMRIVSCCPGNSGTMLLANNLLNTNAIGQPASDNAS